MLYAIYGKGGTGKSTVSRYLVHRAAVSSSVFTSFDADASNGTLTRFYKSIVQRVPDPHPAAMSRWFEEVVWPAAEAGTAILDLGSGAERVFQDWASSAGLAAVAEAANCPVLLVGVLDPSKDALAPLLSSLNAIPDGQHIAVRNAGRAKPGEGFEVIDGHSAWKTISAKARVIDIPMLAVTMPKLDAANLTFAEAEAGGLKDGAAQLSPFDRQRVAGWLRAMGDAWDGL